MYYTDIVIISTYIIHNIFKRQGSLTNKALAARQRSAIFVKVKWTLMTLFNLFKYICEKHVKRVY